MTNNSGPGGGYTNAPGESNCTNSGCHSGTLNSGGSLSNLKLSTNFTGGGYIPDSTYIIKIEMSQSSISKWGFNFTALRASNNDPAGDISITSNRTQRRTKSVSGKTRVYAEHTSTGTSSTTSNATEWVFSWKAPSSNIGDIKFYVAVNAANGNGNTSGDLIYAKDFTASPSSLLPEAQASTKDTLICSGNTAKFIGGGTNSPTTYSWTFPNGSPSVSSDTNPEITFNFPGTQRAILRVRNSKGWSGFDTITIKVVQSPTAFISGNATRKICKGDSVTLTAQFGTGNTYLWSNSKTGNVITVKDTGNYYVYVKSGKCEKASNIIKVEYFTPIKPSFTSSYTKDSICEKEFIKLTANGSYDTFYWYNQGGLIAKTDTNFLNHTMDQLGSMFLKVRDQNGCISSNSDTLKYKVISRDPAPTVTCKNQKPFSVDFDWTGLQSHGGVQVSTNKGGTWVTPSSGSTGNSHSMTGLNPEEDYELWVRGVLSAPCFYTEVTKAVCRTGKCSPLAATVKADSSVCDGETLRVEVGGLAKERFSLSFEGGKPFTDTIFSFTPLVNKTYVIEVLDSAFPACPPKKLSFPVKIDKIDQLQFRTQRPNHTFCQGDTIRFTASSGSDQYEFFVNNKLRATTSDSFYYESQFKDGDSAFVKVQKGACDETSETIYLSVVPTPEATFTYSRVGSIYTFKPDNVNYKTYFWKFGDGFTSVLKEPNHDYKSSSGQIVMVQLDVKDNNECVAMDTSNLQIPVFSSFRTVNSGGVNIYPSPANHLLYLDFDGISNDEVRFEIQDSRGVSMTSGMVENKREVIELSWYPSGVYILSLQMGQEMIYHRFVKE